MCSVLAVSRDKKCDLELIQTKTPGRKTLNEITSLEDQSRQEKRKRQT